MTDLGDYIRHSQNAERLRERKTASSVSMPVTVEWTFPTQPARVEQSAKAKARDILTLTAAVSLSILAVCGALILARALWRLTS